MPSLLKKIAVTVFIFLGLLVSYVPARAEFNCNSGDKSFAGKFKITVNGKPVNTIGGLPQICSAGEAAAIVIKTLLGFAGIVAIIFIMIGGYWYLTAAGNEEQSEKGRKALTSAVLGLAVILMSYAIVTIVANFITSKGSNGAGAGTPPATTPPPGSGTEPPAGGTGKTGDMGNRLSNDPTSMYYYITDKDVRDVDDNRDGVTPTIQPFRQVSSYKFVSTITMGDTQAIVNIYNRCKRRDPSLGFYSLGTSRNDIVVKPYYYDSAKDAWIADPMINRQLEQGEYFQFHVCGEKISYQYSGN